MSLSRRIAKSKVPVNPTGNPVMNAPVWASGVVALLAAVKALTDGWPVWAVVVIVVAFLAFGVITQFFTSPARDQLDHGDAPLDGD